MAQLYECVLIMSPTLNEEGVKGYEEQFSSLITEAKGEIIQVQPWGKRRMAYPIAKRTEAFYTLIIFSLEEGAGGVIEEFERQVRINDDLLREMTIKVKAWRKMDPPSRDIVLGSRGPRPGGRPTGRPGAPRDFRSGPAAGAPAPAPAAAAAATPGTDVAPAVDAVPAADAAPAADVVAPVEAPVEAAPAQETAPAPAETPAPEPDAPPAPSE